MNTKQISWCNGNQDKYEKIIHNAHVYMNKFLDQEQEKHIEECVIRGCLERVLY